MMVVANKMNSTDEVDDRKRSGAKGRMARRAERRVRSRHVFGRVAIGLEANCRRRLAKAINDWATSRQATD
jgi:hypothetical protein